MQKNKLKKHFVLLAVLLLSSCASVPDKWVCTRLNQSQGFCVKTISNEEQTVDDDHPLMTDMGPKTWIDLVIESVIVPIDTWNSIRGYIIKNCKKNHDCMENLDSWNRKFDLMEGKVEVKQ